MYCQCHSVGAVISALSFGVSLIRTVAAGKGGCIPFGITSPQLVVIITECLLTSWQTFVSWRQVWQTDASTSLMHRRNKGSGHLAGLAPSRSAFVFHCQGVQQLESTTKANKKTVPNPPAPEAGAVTSVPRGGCWLGSRFHLVFPKRYFENRALFFHYILVVQAGSSKAPPT